MEARPTRYEEKMTHIDDQSTGGGRLWAVLAHKRFLPVITIREATEAGQLAEALHAGGVGCAEITLRTPDAVRAIQQMLTADTDLIVGAGTVLTVEQVDRVADAGASFIVSPGFDPVVMERARSSGMDCLPGIATATELQQALKHGHTRVKFFPARSLGGARTISALSAPFPSVQFVPSGGIALHNAAAYLEVPAVLAVAGSWLTDGRIMRERDWKAVSCAALESGRALGGGEE